MEACEAFLQSAQGEPHITRLVAKCAAHVQIVRELRKIAGTFKVRFLELFAICHAVGRFPTFLPRNEECTFLGEASEEASEEADLLRFSWKLESESLG